MTDPRPLIAHVVYRFDVGGLENGVVNLINRMPAQRFRHAVIALADITDFKQRVTRDDVQFIALNKPPGQTLKLAPRLFRLFRALKPAIVHTRNLAALETTLPAFLAGVPVRVHGEHGWDVGDLSGTNNKLRWMRRFYKPFVSHYIALSRDLQTYLTQRVGVRSQRVTQIYNGVDMTRFALSGAQRPAIDGCPFQSDDHWLIGTVGRLQPVKDQVGLVRAFAQAVNSDAADRDTAARAQLRLIIVGAGPERARIEQEARALGVLDLLWLAGERNDVQQVLRGLNCFALPSLSEGISNTILEAMATGLPIVATQVGGNAELIDHGATGTVVPPSNPAAMSHALLHYWRNRQQARQHGAAARAAAEKRFSLDRMVADYVGVYEKLLRAHSLAPRAQQSVSSTH